MIAKIYDGDDFAKALNQLSNKIEMIRMTVTVEKIRNTTLFDLDRTLRDVADELTELAAEVDT